MRLLPVVLLFLLVLVFAGPASAATNALLPARTVQNVTVTVPVTVAPVTIPPIARTVSMTAAPAYTCIAPASCMAEQDAIAAWGLGNYVRDSDQSCGTGSPATRGNPVMKYCYRQNVQVQLARTLPPAITTTIAPGARSVVTVAGVKPAGIATTVTTAPPATTAAPAGPEPLSVVATVPLVTPTTVSARQASFVDSVFGFFAGIFGPGQSSGTSTTPGGGEMEPTQQLPGGMKPVTQVTTTLTLVSHEGNAETEWATANVPNTGEFSWYQVDLARDCGLPGNVPCFGPNLTELGVTQTISYPDARDLPPTRDFRVRISTGAMDPYPAFSGQSGAFSIVNGYAFLNTKLVQDKNFRHGSGTPQKTYDPKAATDFPWVGYRDSHYGSTPTIDHEAWRTVITPEFTGLYEDDTVKKATLVLHVKTDKGTGDSDELANQDVKTDQAIAQLWIIDGEYLGFAPKSQEPVIASIDIPTTPGTLGSASYDGAAGTITVDITSGFNQWLNSTSGKHSVVLVGPDENGSDSPRFFFSRVEIKSLTYEKA